MKLRKFTVFIFSVLIVYFSSVIVSAEQKDTDWEYVITRNEVLYSVDMGSVKFFNNKMFFWVASDDDNENKICLFYTVVNPYTREFRFDESHIYNKKTREEIFSSGKPTEWKYISPNSPMKIIVDFIFEHRSNKEENNQ